MLHQTYLTDWHQIFLIAAGFLTAILLVWSQLWVHSFYAERPYQEKRGGLESDRLFSTHIAYLWLSAGVLFAILAFGFTGLHWLLAGKTVQCSLAACLIGRMQQLAAGFLMGAFIIALIAVIQQIFLNAWKTLKAKGEPKPIDYGRHPHERTRNKTCLFRATYAALFLIFFFCLLPALIPPDCWTPIWWLWLALFSFLIPILIVGGTYECISRQRRRKDPCAFRDFILRLCSKCKCRFSLRSSQDP
jgi:hypothetical protein